MASKLLYVGLRAADRVYPGGIRRSTRIEVIMSTKRDRERRKPGRSVKEKRRAKRERLQHRLKEAARAARSGEVDVLGNLVNARW